MKTVTLPKALNLNTSHTINVYDYSSSLEISKQHIILQKNAFSFLLNGTKDVFFDNCSYAINNTQFLLMKSGNCLMTEKLSKPLENYRSVLLFFTNDDVFKFIKKFETTSVRTKYYSTYAFNYDGFIKTFVKSLLTISELAPTLQKNLLNSKFEEIMLYLVAFNGVDFLYSLIENNTDENQKFIQTVQNNQLNKLSLKELAFLSNMSVSTFKRQFEKQFNSSPSKWFQEKRLEHAAYLLKDQNKRPSDVYEEAGYENLSNFIQAFKLKFGVTPKQHQ